MEQVREINQDLALYLEKNTKNAGIKSLEKKRIKMSKEKSDILTVLGVITKESVKRQYNNWCRYKTLHHANLLEHDELNGQLLDVVTDEELKIAIEVTTQSFSRYISSLEDAYITSMLNLIIETKKYSMEETNAHQETEETE
jgi:hypothetical protein